MANREKPNRSNMSLNDEVQDELVRLQKVVEPCNCGTGYVQPPIVKALIKVLSHSACEFSGCKAHAELRDWEEIGEYALWGMLVGVVSSSPRLVEAIAAVQQPDNPDLHMRYQAESAFSEWMTSTRDAEHPGSVALAAVVQAVGQMYGGREQHGTDERG